MTSMKNASKGYLANAVPIKAVVHRSGISFASSAIGILVTPDKQSKQTGTSLGVRRMVWDHEALGSTPRFPI